MMHAQENDGKGIALIKVGNGSDCNLYSLVNEFYFYRFWRDSRLDILGVVSYAAKYSAYNNTEHTYNVMSKRLNSAMLPSVLEGENDPR